MHSICECHSDLSPCEILPAPFHTPETIPIFLSYSLGKPAIVLANTQLHRSEIQVCAKCSSYFVKKIQSLAYIVGRFRRPLIDLIHELFPM